MAHRDSVGIETPSDTDVLSGRGNACNFHPGNEYFRALVRKHKRAYVACPKPQKAKFSRLIVDEIYARHGRFLKQDNKTKLWHDIGDKKALDKTRQALREGAPELLKELQPGDSDGREPRPDKYTSSGRNGAAKAGVPLDNKAFVNAGMVQQQPVGIIQQPVKEQMVLPMQVPSSAAAVQNRRRASDPSLPASLSLPAHLVASAHRQTSQEMELLRERLASLYSPDQLEPTPINPNLQLSMEENARVETGDTSSMGSSTRMRSPVPGSANLEFDSSLEFEKMFSEKQKSVAAKTNNIDELSQQLSAMSFSMGDSAATMSEEGHLSSLFDDSGRTQDALDYKGEVEKVKPSTASTASNKGNMSLGTMGDMSLSTFSESNLGNLGESHTLGTLGESNLGNLQSMNMSTTSFSKVFDDEKY